MSKKANQLYHYTSMNALCEILNGIEGNHITLRATHYEYLNDTTECKLLNEYRSDNKSEHMKDEIYIISFSKSKDNLTMYRHYGNAKGVSLNFDVKCLISSWLYQFCDCEYINSNKEYENIICKYNELKLDRIIPLNIKNILGSKIDNPLSIDGCDTNTRNSEYLEKCRSIVNRSNFKKMFISTEQTDYLLKEYAIKHYSFKPENEKRLIILKDDIEGVQFFEKNGLIKPYIEVQIPVTALKQIWLAPGCDEELSRKSISMLLKSKGVKDIPEIIHSKHPYIDR